MSDAVGYGYGSDHNWRKDLTDKFQYPPTGTPEKATRWICRDCGQVFIHYYDIRPGIFEAMEYAGTPKLCPAKHK